MIYDGLNMSMFNGDDESFTFALEYDTGVAIPLVTGDSVVFTVRTSIDAGSTTLQKTITSFTAGEAVITIDAADTTSLTIMTYIYDIQVTYLDGSVKTRVPPSSFTILKGVT